MSEQKTGGRSKTNVLLGVLEAYLREFPDAIYLQGLRKRFVEDGEEIKFVNGDSGMEYLVSRYLQAVERPKMMIFRDRDPNYRDFFYKKAVSMTDRGMKTMEFFEMGRRQEVVGGDERRKTKMVMYFWAHEETPKSPQVWYEGVNKAMMLGLLDDTTVSFWNKSLYLVRERKLGLGSDYKKFANFIGLINKGFDQLNRERMVIAHGGTYLFYGLRQATDLDLEIYLAKDDMIDKDFAEKIKMLKNVRGLDMKWDETWKSSNLFFDPKFTIYVKGVKVGSLYFDLRHVRMSRIKTGKHPRALVDFIMSRRLIYPDMNAIYEKYMDKYRRRDLEYFARERYKENL